MPAQCKFVHPTGRQCESWCIADSDLCWFHSRKSTSARPETIIDAMRDPGAFGAAFEPFDTWIAWTIFLKAIYGLAMDEDEFALFHHFTGREMVDPQGYQEAYAIAGRRGGKSRISSLIAAYEAIYGGWEEKLSKGERGWIFIIANDRSQAQVVFGYLRSLLALFPDRIERETQEEVHLKSGVSIGVKTCSFRGVRGFSTIGVICDELAFWRDAETSANPASEIITSLLPSLMPGAKLIGISTPYARMGYLYQTYKDSFAKDSDQLVFVGATPELNPTYNQETINRLIARDPSRFESEYFATFRTDIETFLSEALIRAAMTRQLSTPEPRVRYVGFIDPSGGRSDSMTLAISHREGEKVLLDRVEERRPPFDPSKIVEEFAGILKNYGIHSTTSDRYGGAWVDESFRKAGVRIDSSDLPASDLYLEFQPLLSMGRVELIDDERLALQLQSLERRTQSGGKDKVDHPAGGHDDVANAVAGAVVFAARGTTWDEKEQEAHLPQKQHMSPTGIAIDRAQSLEEEMRDWMGLGFSAMNRIVRR